IEVAVGFTPQGAVRGVVVTKATVEMKPWVLEAVAAGLTDHYRGLRPGGAPGGGGRDRGPGRESRCLCGRRGGQRGRPGSCGVRSLLQSCEGLTGRASVTFSATARGGRTSIWA